MAEIGLRYFGGRIKSLNCCPRFSQTRHLRFLIVNKTGRFARDVTKRQTGQATALFAGTRLAPTIGTQPSRERTLARSRAMKQSVILVVSLGMLSCDSTLSRYTFRRKPNPC